MVGLSTGSGEFEPGEDQDKKEGEDQNQEKMGLCWQLGVVEARLASAGRTQPDVGTIVAGEWTVGDDVAGGHTVAGLVMAAEPPAVAEVG